jgi:outer membrane protein OmpA-like peptidoglycan-associated protein
MATHVQDDYLICREYQERIGNKSTEFPGFITFQHENGNHYFAWVNGDQIILRSEAYPDNDKMVRGINAILKNCDLPERYSVDVQHGAHFLVLWGGGDHQAHTGNRDNHSEIGRSCPQKSMEDIAALLQFKGAAFAGIAKASAATTTETAATEVAAAATVVAAAAPIVETAAPVVEAATPVVEAAAPVVEITEPVVAAAAPVVEAAAPVVEAVKEVVVEAPKVTVAEVAAAAAPVVAAAAAIVPEVPKEVIKEVKVEAPKVVEKVVAAAPVVEKMASVNTRVEERTSYATTNETVESTGGGMKWLLPLLGALLAAGAIWYFAGKGCSSDTTTTVAGDTTTTQFTPPVITNDSTATTTTAPVVTGTVDTVTGEYNYNVGNNVDIELPNGGGKITVGENSTEANLIKFLNSSTPVDTAKGNWYEFTNVKFKTGSAEITEASMVQLRNMVAIAKAYPTAKFRIGGYTDNVGKVASNVALSQKRADAVSTKIVSLGADAASLVAAKGFGPEWPIGDNSTAAGRAQNRRVAVNVKAK